MQSFGQAFTLEEKVAVSCNKLIATAENENMNKLKGQRSAEYYAKNCNTATKEQEACLFASSVNSITEVFAVKELLAEKMGKHHNFCY